MTKDLMEAMVRTFLQLTGMFLLSRGIVTADNWAMISAGLFTCLVGLTWMVYARWNTMKVDVKSVTAENQTTMTIEKKGIDQ